MVVLQAYGPVCVVLPSSLATYGAILLPYGLRATPHLDELTSPTVPCLNRAYSSCSSIKHTTRYQAGRLIHLPRPTTNDPESGRRTKILAEHHRTHQLLVITGVLAGGLPDLRGSATDCAGQVHELASSDRVESMSPKLRTLIFSAAASNCA